MAKKDAKKSKEEINAEEVEAETVNAEETEESPAEKSETELLNEETEKLQKELAASKEAHIRTLAEYDNFRKRTQKEKDAIYTDSKVRIFSELLPVMDNFERAAASDSADLESYKKGIEMTFNGFRAVFEKLGIESFGEKGDTFDPNLHNAVMHCEDEELGENVVAEVFQTGYKTGDKILRPAMVKVAN